MRAGASACVNVNAYIHIPCRALLTRAPKSGNHTDGVAALTDLAISRISMLSSRNKNKIKQKKITQKNAYMHELVFFKLYF